MKLAWIRMIILSLASYGIVYLVKTSEFAQFAFLVCASCNFYIGLWWAQDCTSVGTMKVLPRPEVRLESWKSKIRKFLENLG